MNTTQPQGSFCQSCAMPMAKPEDFGTNADGSQNQEYCHYCFQNGKFIEPNITMEQMIEKCAGIMRQMKMPEAQIEQTKTFIPMLKRWKK
ncbi:MAG: transcriptional regulator [Candidatus Moranbacteria bacterium CG23_combo_of_CG06-09_8_20_14_all_40_16]|nr:MAG: transcriptional regulator [Candidatus Moranbacteria bacterium CG23_combo_of_CG06-09_8_20_14_all_40_16]